MAHRRAVVLALLLGSASAAEKTPAMVWTGAAPSGACKGSRVVAIYDTGALYCCVTGAWASCGAVGGGGSGLPSDPAACPGSQWVIDQNASGVLTCSQPGWTDIASKPATFAPSAHTHPGGDVTSTVANATLAATATTALAAPWSGLTGVPTTFPATVPVSSATALAGTPAACTGSNWMKSITSAGVTTCAQLAYSDLTGTPAAYTLPAASTTLGGVKMASACGAGNHVSSIGALGELGCTADAGGGAPTTSQYWVGAADGALSAEKDLSGFTGIVKNTAGTPSVAVAGDLPGGPYEPTITTLAQAKGGTGAGSLTCGAGQALTSNGTAQSCTGTLTASAVTGTPVSLTANVSGILPAANGGTGNGFFAISGPASATKTWTIPNASLTIPTPVAGAVMYSSSTTAFAQTANPTTGQVLVGTSGTAPVWVAAQTCTSSAATTCTITVARSGCTPVCGMGASAAGSTWVRAAVATTTLTCTFSTSGTNICNCFCP